MSKFDKFGNNDATFAEIKEKTAENGMTFKLVDVKHLLRCIYNKEDVSYTEDIEKSIDEIGFADPIEIMFIDRAAADTNKLKCLEGAGSEHRYLILSGHRRYEAALKKGMKEIPCAQINKVFINDAEIENYVLMSNCHRDSAKDPLLLYKRYMAHMAHFAVAHPDIKAADTDRAIAPRMGLSAGHIRRFRSLATIIEPIFDMVRKEEIALSGIERLAVLTPEQQTELYDIFQSILHDRENSGEDREISRSEANRIVREYKSGDKISAESVGVPLSNNVPDELQKVTELHTVCKNGIDTEDKQENSHGCTDESNDEDCDNDDDDKYLNSEERNSVIGSLGQIAEKTYGSHKSLLWLLDKLTDTRGALGCDWTDLKNEDEAVDKAQIIANAISDLIDEIHSIFNQYQLEDERADILSSIVNAVGKQGKFSHPTDVKIYPARSMSNASQPGQTRR